jgi:hypothetical protein
MTILYFLVYEKHSYDPFTHPTCTCTVVRHEYNNSQMFGKFITAVNSQNNYNKDGIVRAIPIIIHHTIVTYSDLSYSNRPIDTTLNLFDAEMRYLYEMHLKS